MKIKNLGFRMPPLTGESCFCSHNYYWSSDYIFIYENKTLLKERETFFFSKYIYKNI